MKKFLICSALLFASMTFAQTTAPKVTVVKQAVTTKTDTTLEGIEKNIDRRITHLNKYKKNGEMENMSKIVSDKNKDFYTNFIQYMKNAPIFSIKRDLKGKIIKTPTNEYVLPVIISLDGKENNATITFIEEKTEQGNIWLISNSNLHIQTVPSKTDTNLGSTVINESNRRPSRNPNTTSSKIPPTTPVAKAPETPQPATTTPLTKEAPLAKGIDLQTIIIIALASISILGGIVGYSLFAKNRRAKILAVSLSSIAASTITTASTIPLTETAPLISEMPVISPEPIVRTIPESNVTISSVGAIHTETPAPTSMPQLPQEGIIPTPTSPQENILIKTPTTPMIILQENTEPPILTIENESPYVAKQPETPSKPATLSEIISIEKELPPLLDEVKIIEIASQPETTTYAIPEIIIPEIPLIETPILNVLTTVPEPQIATTVSTETPISNLFTTAPEPQITPTVSIETPTTHQEPHALFDGVFNTPSAK